MSDSPHAWHAMAPEAVAEALGVGVGGLTRAQAEAARARFGDNTLSPPTPTSSWTVLVRQFRSPLIYVLVVAGGVALALGHLGDAIFIAIVLAINGGIGFYNEAKAERDVLSLTRLVRSVTRVVRDGHPVTVDSREVVPGDVVLLESGMRVPADGRLLEVRELRVDESLLTGESVPVGKAGERLDPSTPMADQRSMAFAGSMVTSGRARALVVATGMRTRVGAIATGLSAIDTAAPPLVVAMERFGRLVGGVAIGISAVVVGLGLALGEPLGEMLLTAVALAVAAIPEGLPIALTVALAVGVRRMAGRGVVIRHLPAVEALGSCGVIATDKTGTLTRNELTVERIVAGGADVHLSGTGYAPRGEARRGDAPLATPPPPRIARLLRAGCLANEGTLERSAEGEDRWDHTGDPTDVALLSAARKAGVDPHGVARDHPAVGAIPFESEHRFAASFHRLDGGGLACVKGAPEAILARCVRTVDPDSGEEAPLDRAAAMAEVQRLMGEGYRVLAIADRVQPDLSPDGHAALPADLTWLGLIGMTDPPREEVPDAIARCRSAGVHVVMITGDHATTAGVIAARVGLATGEGSVLEGADVAAMSDAALAERLPGVSVVARATPDDKLRVVQAWQARGEWVAVTGDGVNDAPALRQANLGAAMGMDGTDVAREASQLIITDDNFASLVNGIEEGRVAYANVRKVIFLLLSTGVGEVILLLCALPFGFGVPLTAAQLLWLNLVTNGIQDVALAFEPGEEGVLNEAPRPPSEPIINGLMVTRVLLSAAGMAAVTLAAWWWMRSGGVPLEEARNAMVQLVFFCEILDIGNARSERVSAFRLNPLRNPVLIVGTLAAVGLQLGATWLPWTQQVLQIGPTSWQTTLTMLALSVSVLVGVEGHKLWLGWERRRRARA